MIGALGLLMSLLAVGFSAGATGGKRRVATLYVEALDDGGLCRKLIVDEAQLAQQPMRDVFNDAPLGSHIVSLRPVGGPLGGFTRIEPPPEFENGWVEVGSIPAIADAAPKTLYHIAGGSHYFDGGLYVITGTEVASDDVLSMIWKSLLPSGSVESIVEQAKAANWATISGADTPYQTIRYTRFWSFLDKGRVYFLAQGNENLLRSREGRKLPAFVLLRPDQNGTLHTLCRYRASGPHL
jgi:hypothetical protein